MLFPASKGEIKGSSPSKSTVFQQSSQLLGLLGRLKPKSATTGNNWEGDVTFARQVETLADQVNRDSYLNPIIPHSLTQHVN